MSPTISGDSAIALWKSIPHHGLLDTLGIEIVDLRMTRVDLPAQNSAAVYRRMKTEREREAADIRANGEQARAKQMTLDARASNLARENKKLKAQLKEQGDVLARKDKELSVLRRSAVAGWELEVLACRGARGWAVH